MSGLGSEIELALREQRDDFRTYPVDIHDVSISTGAGMYRQQATSEIYVRSGALALSSVAQYNERYPGGFTQAGRSVVVFGAGETGLGGPTNRALILRTGSQSGLKLHVQNAFWRPVSATECKDTDELVVDLERIE